MKTKELITFKETISRLKHKTELDIINAHILEALEKGLKWAIIQCDSLSAKVEEELIKKGYRWQWHSETKTVFHEHKGHNQEKYLKDTSIHR